MPSAYAHYRLGRQVCPLLGPKEQQTILECPEPFLIGLHGPDIFFYHHPLAPSPLNRMGHRMHGEPGEAFFRPAADVLSAMQDRQAGLSYLYGFLCHFALDSTCHPYVEAQVKRTGIAHMELEAEFDRRLMLHDGLDPLSHFPAGHIIPSRRNAEAIAPFFAPASSGQILETLQSMLTCSRLLVAPHLPKRLLIQAAFAISGNYSSMQGVMIPLHPDPACIIINRRLGKLYHKALPLAVCLIRNYRRFTEGAEELDACFHLTFG
ncbi:MAG TPA: zinc dependent phospholipase C family protein [Candidatus Eisenbergiella merdipullorum]|uniref:Zinc dependent phospholipase C family protein n=1 Tax=Candidatus Eisenbergiella merdipullorum TaxID=2838553 RepID=A0A9D2L1H7_9FIRM|nr:zinc dependent phospholipase C family protein [Candidatus Eisenbergiella merdipullorum]